jgi:hypothetical protein
MQYRQATSPDCRGGPSEETRSVKETRTSLGPVPASLPASWRPSDLALPRYHSRYHFVDRRPDPVAAVPHAWCSWGIRLAGYGGTGPRRSHGVGAGHLLLVRRLQHNGLALASPSGEAKARGRVSAGFSGSPGLAQDSVKPIQSADDCNYPHHSRAPDFGTRGWRSILRVVPIPHSGVTRTKDHEDASYEHQKGHNEKEPLE